jgi:ribokinase
VSPIVVIGDTTLDVTVTPSEPMRHGADVPAAVRLGPGGQGANVAVRLARQGLSVELVTALADDPAATFLRAALEADGVDVVPVAVATSATVVILLDADGERSMLSQRAPFADRAAAAVDPAADWIVVSGYLLLEREAASAALVAALAAQPARRALLGCSVPDGRLQAWRDSASALRCDLVVLNREEADAIGALGSLAAATVVTDAGGATARIGETTVDVPRPPDGRAVDTTGAGDAFAATLIGALTRGAWPPAEAALASALAGAMALATEVARATGAQGHVAGERAAAGHT